MDNNQLASSKFGILPWLNSSIFIAGVIFLSFLFLSWNDLPSWNVDNGYYINVLQGEPVRRPFSTRILYPNIAKLIMNISGMTIAQSFIVANTFALLLFLLSATHLIKKLTFHSIITIPLLFNPFLLRSFQEAYIPDLLFLGLVCLYFVLIYHSCFITSQFLLLLLCITRDDTLLLLISIILVGIYLSNKKLVLSTVMIMVLGITINSISARFGLPSPANMNPFLFYLVRIPSNLFYNVTGMPIWSNIYADICHPILKINLPHWLPFGNLHSVGLCPLNITTPFRNISFILTTLGVLPSLLVYILIKNYKIILKSTPDYIMIALVYGIIAFISSIVLSMDLMRHLGQGWPAVWLAMISILPLYYKMSKSFIYRVSIINLIISWVPWIIFLHKVKPTSHYQFSINTLPILLFIGLFSIAGHFLALSAMRKQEKLA